MYSIGTAAADCSEVAWSSCEEDTTDRALSVVLLRAVDSLSVMLLKAAAICPSSSSEVTGSFGRDRLPLEISVAVWLMAARWSAILPARVKAMKATGASSRRDRPTVVRIC